MLPESQTDALAGHPLRRLSATDVTCAQSLSSLCYCRKEKKEDQYLVVGEKMHKSSVLICMGRWSRRPKSIVDINTVLRVARTFTIITRLLLQDDNAKQKIDDRCRVLMAIAMVTWTR